jgi:cytochrome c-type biogenesis protein CcmF
MRKKFLWPTVAGLVGGVIFFIIGVRHFMTLLTLILAVFAIGLVLGEVWRPVQARRQAHGEGWGRGLVNVVTKNRRRYGGYIVHLGIVIIAVGIALSSTYRQDAEVTLRPGESAVYAGYTVRLDSLYAGREPHRDFVEAAFSVGKGGSISGVMRPRLNYYPNSQQPIGTPSVRTRPGGDLYLSLMAYAQDGSTATVNVIFNPMIVWIWIGGGIVTLGALFAISTVGLGTGRPTATVAEPQAEPMKAGVGGAD